MIFDYGIRTTMCIKHRQKFETAVYS